MRNICILLTLLLCRGIELRSTTPDSWDRNRQVRYEVMDIGPLPSVSDDVAAHINTSGEISWWQAMPDQTTHAFAWNSGSLQDLGTLNGYVSSVSSNVNARGEIVGWAVSGKNLVDNQATTHAFVYSHARMIDLKTLGGRDSKAIAANGSEEVVGWSSVPDSSHHAFRYRGGKLDDLGTLPGGSYSAACAINQSGLIAGAAETANHSVHAVIWTGNGIVDLGTLPGGMRSRARGLNDRGEIVGFSEAEGAETHAFFYENGQMQDLGSLGHDPVRANAINNRSQIVGASGVTLYVRHAFLWEGGKMLDLNKCILQAAKWRLQEAIDINDTGQILCIGARADAPGARHLLLLQPVPNAARPDAAE